MSTISRVQTISDIPKFRTLDSIDNSTIAARIETITLRAKEEISEYLTFPDNWDGYKGKRFVKETAFTANLLIDIIRGFFIDEGTIPEEITPGPLNDGSIDIEINHRNKCVIYTIHQDKELMTIYSEDSNNRHEEECYIDRIVLEAKLIWLVN